MTAPPWWRAATRAERAAGLDAPPGWWRELEAALAPGTRAPVRDRDDRADGDVIRGALRLVAPFVRRAQGELRAHPSATDATARALAKALAEELVELARPAVALELVAARAAGGWSDEELERETAATLRALGRPQDARTLLSAHPGLARMIVGRAGLAVQAGHELLERVAADREHVRDELLDGEEPGEVVAIALAGDSHDGGRRVARVQFASGARAALKPRSLAAERGFADVLVALNGLGFEPRLRPVTTLACGRDHGWQAWAQPASCSSRAELGRYFRRLGAQLAILHALRATDMHQENVLACGEHPMLVDLETVLHPRLGSERAGVVDPLIAETGLDCVLRVGLLPRSDVAFGVDISGLGRDPAGEFEASQLGWIGAGADARLVMQRLRLEPGDNAPRLRGRPVRPHEHVGALADGFSDAYGLLLDHRDRLLAPGGALASLRGPTRVVLRPTKVYADLLRRQSQDLACLDDGVAREDAFDVLWRGAGRRAELGIVAPAERYDLSRGDVPRFTTTAGGADGAHHALGRLAGMLGPHRAAGPAVVNRLDADDRARQLSYLRSSVLAAAAATPPRSPAAAPGVDASTPRAVARRLQILALHDGDSAGWLAPVALPPAGARVLRPVEAGLRRGQAGIALLLGLLGHELAPAATRRLEALASAGGLPAEVRGELLLAFAALEGVRDRDALVRRLAAPAGGDASNAPAQLVLGLGALPAAREGDLRDRLERAAAALAARAGPPALLTILALAAAAQRLGEGPGGPLAAAATAHAERLDLEGSPLARVVALTALARSRPPRAALAGGAQPAARAGRPPRAALARGARPAARAALPPPRQAALGDRLAGLLGGLTAPELITPEEPTARALAVAVIVDAAARALGPGAAEARSLVRALVARASGPPRFEDGAETPVLEDGLAGIGLAWRALDGDRDARGAVIAAWSARYDERHATDPPFTQAQR